MTFRSYGPFTDFRNVKSSVSASLEQFSLILISFACIFFFFQSTSYCATDLAAHNPFFFRISAKNRIGFSKPSPVSDVIVTKDSNPTHRLSVDSDGKVFLFIHLLLLVWSRQVIYRILIPYI